MPTKIKFESDSTSVSAKTIFGPNFDLSIESVISNSDEKLKVITDEEVAANLQNLSSTSFEGKDDGEVILYYKCKIGIHAYKAMLSSTSTVTNNKKWEALVSYGDAIITIMGEKTNKIFSIQAHCENRIAYHQIITDDLETVVASRDPPICFISRFTNPMHLQMGFELQDKESLMNFRLAFHCAKDRKFVWDRAIVVGGQLEIYPRVIGRGNLLNFKHGQLFFLVDDIDGLHMRVPKFVLPKVKSKTSLNSSFEVVFKRSDNNVAVGKKLLENKTNTPEEKAIDEGVQCEPVANKDEANQTKPEDDVIKQSIIDMTNWIDKLNERSRSRFKITNTKHSERQSRSKVRGTRFRRRLMDYSEKLRDKSRDAERPSISRASTREKSSKDTTRSRSKIRNAEKRTKSSNKKKSRSKGSKFRKMKSRSKEKGIQTPAESIQMGGDEIQERGDAENIRPETISKDENRSGKKVAVHLEDNHEPRIFQVFPVALAPSNVSNVGPDKTILTVPPNIVADGRFSLYKNKKLSYYEFKKSLRNEVDEDDDFEDDEDEQDILNSNKQQSKAKLCSKTDNNNNTFSKCESSKFSMKDRGRVSRMLLAKENEELRIMINNEDIALSILSEQTRRVIDTSEALDKMNQAAWRGVTVWQRKIKEATAELNEFKKKVLDHEQRALKKVVPKQSVFEENERLLIRIRQVEERIQTQEEEFQRLKCRGAPEDAEEFIPKVEAMHQSWKEKCILLKQLEKEKTDCSLVFISVDRRIYKSIQTLIEINARAICNLDEDLRDSAYEQAVGVYTRAQKSN